jgi:hypothetical protein
MTGNFFILSWAKSLDSLLTQQLLVPYLTSLLPKRALENTILHLQLFDPNYKYKKKTLHTTFREKAIFKDSPPRLNTRITWGIRFSSTLRSLCPGVRVNSFKSQAACYQLGVLSLANNPRTLE